ncbi:unnamed protein product, partial [Brassica rapa subsp. narinosa]
KQRNTVGVSSFLIGVLLKISTSLSPKTTRKAYQRIKCIAEYTFFGFDSLTH